MAAERLGFTTTSNEIEVAWIVLVCALPVTHRLN
jgi:hypothetical protein